MAKKKGATLEEPESGPVVLSEEDLTEVQGGTNKYRPPQALVTWGTGFLKFKKSGGFTSDDTA